MAVLLITHDLYLVRRFADRVAVMEQGVLVEQGPVAQVMTAPLHPYTKKLMASKPQRNVNEEPVPADTLPALAGQGLRVSYPTPLPGIRGWFKRGSFVALKGADLRIPPGRTLGVVGESGSGKSTLAQAVLGLLPFEGELKIEQQAWQQPAMRNTPANRELRRVVQVVFQDPFSSLSPRMTVEEIVAEGLLVHAPQLSAGERQNQVLEMLNAVGLTDAQFPGLLQRYPHEFSGGQRQRLAIARALIVQP